MKEKFWDQKYEETDSVNPSGTCVNKAGKLSMIALLATVAILLTDKQVHAELLIVEIPPEPASHTLPPTEANASFAPSEKNQDEEASAQVMAGIVLTRGAVPPTADKTIEQEPVKKARIPESTISNVAQPIRNKPPESTTPLAVIPQSSTINAENSGLVIVTPQVPILVDSKRQYPSAPFSNSAALLLPVAEISANSGATNLIITHSADTHLSSATLRPTTTTQLVETEPKESVSGSVPDYSTQPTAPVTDTKEVVDQNSNNKTEVERERIIENAKEVAADMNSTFACAAGVQTALNKAGFPEFMGTGDGWAMRYAFFNSPKWRVTNDPNKATAFVREWTPEVVDSYGDRYQGRNLGHVGVIYRDKNNQFVELSDHMARHNLYSKRYQTTIYFEFVG